MARDRDANLWLGTARGLMRISPEGSFDEDRRNRQRAEAVGAIFEDREELCGSAGRVDSSVIVTVRFLTYSPVNATNSESSGPVFTDAPGRTWFGPSYVALSLASPERLRYRYRLDGLDSEWSEPTPARDVLHESGAALVPVPRNGLQQ